MNKIYIKIKGISCNNCESEIVNRLKSITNIKNVSIKKILPI